MADRMAIKRKYLIIVSSLSYNYWAAFMSGMFAAIS